jgi:hypothetical protein
MISVGGASEDPAHRYVGSEIKSLKKKRSACIASPNCEVSFLLVRISILTTQRPYLQSDNHIQRYANAKVSEVALRSLSSRHIYFSYMKKAATLKSLNATRN